MSGKRKPKWRGLLADCSPDAIKLTRAMLSKWLDENESGKILASIMGKKRALAASMELIDEGLAYFDVRTVNDGFEYRFVTDIPWPQPSETIH